MTDEERDAQLAPAEETRLHRGRRYALHTRLYTSVVFAVLAIVYLILLIARNTRHVKVDYIFGSGNARVVWLIVVSAIAGWVLGLATSFLLRRRTRRLG
jgi:uncharacterized integral membrane protein